MQSANRVEFDGAFAQARELRATIVADRPEPARNSYELWMLRPDGAARCRLAYSPTGQTGPMIFTTLLPRA